MSTTSPASGVSASEMPPPRVVEDLLGLVQLLSDGTVKRAQARLVLPDDEVIVLRPTVNPDLVEDVRLALEIETDRFEREGQRFVEQNLNA